MFRMVLNLTAAASGGTDVADSLESQSGQRLSDCYQCGKCTAGCPVSFAMDLMPHQVVRLLQLGLRDEALNSKTIWLCATCATCTTRCPRNVDLARLMDTLRIVARQEGRTGAGKSVALFNEVFLDSVRRYGRAHELEVGLRHNLRSGRLLKDSDLARRWFVRGRLRLLPQKIKEAAEIKRIFAEIGRMEGGR